MKIFAMDIGGSSIKYALLDENRNKLDSGKIKTPAPTSMDGNCEYTVKDLYDAIDTIVPSDIDGIALSMPGVIDSENGIALTGGALIYIQNEPVEKVLSEKYGVPVWVGNDAKCAGSAEVGYGALKDVQDSVAIILGTGIGGCLIKDKKVHNGRRFSAGEVSCLYTNNAYPADYHGLWAFTSGIAGLLGLVQKYLETDEKYSGEEIFEMANAGNGKVLAALDEFCFYIALQLYNIQAIFDPEKFAIGGGISAQPLLIEKINEQYKKLFLPMFPLRPVEVVACEFRNDANLIGAYYQLQTKMVSAC